MQNDWWRCNLWCYVSSITEIVQARLKQPLWHHDFLFNLTKAGRDQRKYLKILHRFTRSVSRYSTKTKRSIYSFIRTKYKPAFKHIFDWVSITLHFCWLQVIEERRKELDEQLANHTGKVTMEELEKDGPFRIGKQKRLAFLDMLLVSVKGGADLDLDGIQEEVDTFMFEVSHNSAALLNGSLPQLCVANSGLHKTRYWRRHLPSGVESLEESLELCNFRVMTRQRLEQHGPCTVWVVIQIYRLVSRRN